LLGHSKTLQFPYLIAEVGLGKKMSNGHIAIKKKLVSIFPFMGSEAIKSGQVMVIINVNSYDNNIPIAVNPALNQLKEISE